MTRDTSVRKRKSCLTETEKEKISECKKENFTLSMNETILRDVTEHSRRQLIKDIDSTIHEHMQTLVSKALDISEFVKESRQDLLEKDDKYKDKHKNRRNELPGKLFVHRSSVLSDLLKISHIRSLYHFFLAVLIIIPINTVLSDFLIYGNPIQQYHLEFVQWSFGQFDRVILIWLAEFSTALLVFLLFHLWAKFRTKKPQATSSDYIALVIYLGIQIALISYVTWAIFYYDLPPGSSFILTIELIRLMMKMHAFVMSNRKKAFSYIPSHVDLDVYESRKNSLAEGASQNNTDQKYREHVSELDGLERMASGSNQPKFMHFLYFLFIPTAVFQDSYPKTSGINWRRALAYFTECIFCTFYTVFIFERFLRLSADRDKSYFTIPNAVYLISSAALPAGLLMLLAFFSFLHSWMNLFGEVLCFADRLFYKDWWNSRTYAEYYRKWNVVVHDWLYTYVYVEVYQLTKMKPLASVLVFLLSSVFHEYVLSVSFKFFYPVLFFQFGFFGVILFFINIQNRLGNLFIWLSLMIGNGINMVLYTIEWYARKECPTRYPDSPLMDFVVPRTWYCKIN